MRAIALLSTRNERRFIAGCLEHLIRQGLEVVLLEDGSTDGTVELAETFLGRGLLRIHHLQHDTYYHWCDILRLKEQFARELDADWFLHVDADEIRLPWRQDQTLVECFAQATAEGYNALDFTEYTFMPTREEPWHDHPRFLETMLWYHPYQPMTPCRLTAWRNTHQPVELAWKGGHVVRFPGIRPHPCRLKMKHYLFLSPEHAVEKYVRRKFLPEELQRGWHGWRADMQFRDIHLPSQRELRFYVSDDDLDPSDPRNTYFVEDTVLERLRRRREPAGAHASAHAVS